MEIDLDALAKLPRDKALQAFVKLTAYQQRQATHSAISALAAASMDIEAILARRGETDALIDAEAKKVAAAKERLTQALAATEDEPDCPNDDARRAAVRGMEATIAKLQTTGAAHVAWLGVVLATLDAERVFLDSLLAERKRAKHVTPADQTNIGLALVCVMDASLSAIDPSGAALRRAHFSLREGLRLAEEMNAANNDAASIIREVVASISESENL